MSKMDKFAVLILTHKRADNMKTIKTLRKQGYTGRIICVIDNLDDTRDLYIKNFGKENVYIFDKNKYANLTDTLDNFGKMNIVVYARNATFDIAKDLGLEYFLVLDDDYQVFEQKRNVDGKLKGIPFKDMDKVIEYSLDFLEESGAVTVTFAQGGDFIGGVGNELLTKRIKRKAMNSFFCKTERKFQFVGTINEDTNTYTVEGTRGKLFITLGMVSLTQTTTQANKGGLTDIYLEEGTYVKSFYTVIVAPSCTTIRLMGSTYMRAHHSIKWKNCTPMIVREELKK